MKTGLAMNKSWKVGKNIIRGFARFGSTPARKVAAVAGEPVGIDVFGRLVGGLAPAMVISLMTARAVAGPDGAQVAAGNVTIQKQGDKTVIHASNNSIINYKSFNISKNETVQFVQPDALARVLNRINSASPTQIDGKLLANGRVFIVNPAGVIFGQGAVVNAAGIYAAAGRITDADFVKGIHRFTDVKGAVVNNGTLEAKDVALIGKSVANTGTIIADKGAVIMASGDSVMVGEVGGRVYVKVEQDVGQAGASGSSASQVANSSWAVGDMYSLAIRNTGTVKAATVHAEAKTGVVSVGGTIDASSATAGEKGGSVKLLGQYVGVSGTIDASGPAGGGEVLVGGNYQGHGQEANAIRTTVTPSATIKASATSAGDGGRVIVWSDDQTVFSGHIDAHGRGDAGKGGFAEVSGKNNLNFRGTVNLSGSAGVGTLLLDPAIITITGGTGDGDVDGTATFTGDPSGVEGSIDFADVGPTTVFESEIEGLVGTAANIVLQATQSIVTSGTFGGGTLSLGATNLSLQTSNAAAAGVIDLSGVSIVSTSGNIQVLGSTSGVEACDITLGTISTGGGGIAVTSGKGFISAGGTLDTAGGNINLTTLDGPLSVNAAATVTGAGDIVINSTGGQTTIAGALTSTAGAVTLGNTGAAGATISQNVSGNTGVTFTRAVTLGSGLTIASSTGSVEVVSSLDTGAGAVTIQAAQINFGGGADSVDGTGSLTLRPTSDATSISIGDAATGTFDLDTADIDALGTTFSGISIGSATGTGLTTVGTAAFSAPVLIQQGGVAGQIALTSAAQLTNSNGAIALTAGTGDSGSITKPDGATIDAGAGLVSLTADAMDLGTASGTILTSGGVVLQPSTTTRPIVIAAAGTAGDLVLSQAEVDDVISGESFVVIGRATGQHAISLNAVTFGSATTVRTPSGGSITVNGSVSAPSMRLQGAKTLATGASVTGSSGLLLDGGTSTVTGAAVSVSGGTGTLTAGVIDVGTNQITLTGDEITLDGAVTGSGASSVVLQPSAAGVSIDIGVDSGGTGTLDLSDAEIANITGVGALTIGNAAGTHTIVMGGLTFAVPTTVRTPSGGSIAVNGAVVAPGIRLQGVKSFNSGAAVTATGTGIILDGGAATLNANLTLTGDEIDLGSTLGGAFALTLQPTTDTTTIGVGGGAGVLDISDTDIGNISGTTGITIGRSSGTHAIAIDTSSFADPVLIRGGALTTSGTLTGTGDATIALTGSSVGLGGNLVTAGRAVAISGPVTITTATSTIDTTNSGGSVAGANVSFTGTISAQSAGSQGLAITAGTGGTIDLQSTVGSTALSTLSLNGGTLQFGGVTTTGAATFISRTALSSTGLLNIGGLATFETRQTVGRDISVTNVGNTFGSVRARTRSDDGTGGSVAGDISLFESGSTNIVEGESGGSFSITSTGNVTFSGPVSAGTDVTSAGVNFTSDAGAFIQATDGSININHTGVVTINDTVDASLNASAQNVSINGSAITLNSTVTADDDVSLAASTGTVTVSAAVTATNGQISVTGNDVTLDAASSLTAGTTASVDAAGAVQVAGDVTAPTSITLRSGSDGVGNLSFSAAGVDLNSASITLRAGDGTGGGGTLATVNALTNSPSFHGAAGGATSPTTYVHRQDGNITVSQIAAPSQFQAATNVQGVNYTLQSDDGLFVIAANIDFGGARMVLGASDVQASGVEVNSGTGLITFSSTLALHGNNLTLTANELNFAGGADSVTGTGGLTLQPSGSGITINVGPTSGSADFDITDAELAALAPTLNLVTIGRSGGTHIINIDSALIRDPFVFRGATANFLSNAGGNALSGTGRGSATVTTAAITLSDDIRTEGGAISLDGNVTLAPGVGNSITVLTTDNSATGGDITFGGTTNSDGTSRDLIVNAGDSSLLFTSTVGATPLASLTATGASITLPAVTTTAAQSYTGPTTLGGNLTSNTGGAITVTGAATLAAPVTIQTNGGSASDDITITGAITGASNPLTLNSGAQGGISLQSGATGLTTFTATGASIATRNVTTSGAQSFTGPSTVTGSLITTTAGGITFTGNATVTGGVSATAGNILFNNAATLGGNLTTATSGQITVTGATTLTGTNQTFQTANGNITLGSVTGASNLTLNSGTAAISFGAVGATRLTSLTATGATIAATSTVDTTGNQSYTGATTLGGNLSTTGGSTTVTGATTLSAPVTVATSGGDINFGSITGGSNALTLNAGAGDIVLSGDAGSLASMTATGATIALRSVTTSGAQLYTGAVSLQGTLESDTAGSINITGATTLTGSATIQTAGAATDDVSLDAVTGGGNSLAINAGGGDVDVSGPIAGVSNLTVTGATIALTSATTTGDQNYTGVTTATGNLSTTTSGSVIFTGNATVGGNVSTTGGNIDFNNNASLAGNLTSAGTIGVTGTTTLTGASQNFSAAGATLTLGPVTGPANLSLSAPAGVISVGAVGATPLQSFAAAAPTINATSTVQTSGGQLYDGDATFGGDLTTAGGNVTVTGDAALTPSNLTIATSGGTVNVTGNVTGATTNLTVTAGAGDVDLSGALHDVGNTGIAGLNSLSITGRDISIGRVVTTGSQTYTASRDVDTNGQLRALGASDLTITGPGVIRLRGNLVTDGSGDILVSGPVTLSTATLAANTGGGDITFSSDINSASDGVGDFSLNAGAGNVTFSGNVGSVSNARPASVTATGALIALNGVTTTGAQQYTGATALSGGIRTGGSSAVTFTGPSTLLDDILITTGGGVTFTQTVNSITAGLNGLTIEAGSAPIAFQGAVGTTALQFLTATGAVTSGNITTTNDQTYSGSLNTTGALTSTAGAIAASDGAFSVTGDVSAANAFTVAAGGAPVAVTGVTSAASTSLAGSTINVAAVTTTSGGQTYTGNTVASGNLTSAGAIAATGGLSVNGNISAVGALTAVAGGENVSLTGTTTAASIALSGANIAVAGATSTAGGQTYTGETAIGGDLTATGGGITVTGNTTLAGPSALTFQAIDQVISLGQIEGAGRSLTVNAGTGAAAIQGFANNLNNVAVTAANITLAQITSNGGQTYTGAASLGGDLTAGGPVSVTGTSTLTAPVTISTGSAGTIELAGVTGGNNALNLNGGASTVTMTGDATGLASFTATSFSINTRSVTSTGAQNYLGPLTATGNLASTSSGGINVAGAAQVTGNVSANNGMIDFENAASLGGNVLTTGSGNIRVVGATTLTGSGVQLFKSEQGSIGLNSIDSADSTRRSLTLASGGAVSTTDSAARIRIAGSVGAVNPLATFQIGEINTTAAVPPVATAVIAPAFEESTGRVPKSEVNFDTPASFTINADDFVMARGEKLTAFGNLTVNSSHALLRDMNTIGALVINSPDIRLAGRQRAPLTASGSSVPETDIGLDFVGSKGVTFSSPATVENLDGGTEVTFGADAISSKPTVNGGPSQFLQFEKGVTAESFQRTGGDVNFLLPLDLRADGRSSTNVATAIAGATPREADIGPAQGVGISAALKDQLSEVGIYVKELTLDEQIDFLAGRAIYNDIPKDKVRPAGSDFQITPNRLAVDRVRDVLDAHRAVKQVAMKDAPADAVWTDRAAEIVSAAWTACGESLNKSPADVTGAELAAFVQDNPAQSQMKDLLLAVKVFMARIDELGLSPGEAAVPKETVLVYLAGRDVTTEQVADAVKAINAPGK